MGKLFGTDGIRGVANRYPMTAWVALKTGQAVAAFTKKMGGTKVIIGKDTRISGDMIEAALAAGISSMGINVLLAGVIPTPGVAFLVSTVKGVGAGVVISASHNPFYDNGIKIFKSGGLKLTDQEEGEIEDFILARDPNEQENHGPVVEPGSISILSDALMLYADFLQTCYEKEFDKNCVVKESFRIVADCSNGAAYKVAPMVFSKLGFDAEFIFNTPDGRNINHDCGSQHTETLSRSVVAQKADLGLAFDGDADRLILVDENGVKITGDTILATCAAHAKENARLKNNLVVSTVMSNIGLSKAMASLGIDLLKTGVGDREVLKKMWDTGAVMGGEDSGHMIFSEFHTTGDGILSALCLLRVMADTGKPLSALSSIMTVYPQVLMNVEVDASRPDFMKIKAIADEIESVENQLKDTGRVLVRYAGTQHLLRVTVEGPDSMITEEFCHRICNSIKEASI